MHEVQLTLMVTRGKCTGLSAQRCSQLKFADDRPRHEALCHNAEVRAREIEAMMLLKPVFSSILWPSGSFLDYQTEYFLT